MSATWDLKIGRRTLMWGKRFVPDQIMVVFYDEDLNVNHDSIEREQIDGPENEELSRADVSDGSLTPAFFYRSTVAAIRSRLALQGFGPDRVRQSAVRYLDGERDEPDRYLPETWEPFVEKFRRSEQLLDAMLAWEADSLRGRRMGGSFHSEDGFLERQWEDLIETFDDPRFVLALKLRHARGSSELVLDMTDLLFGGYFEAEELPHRTARQRYAHEIRSSGPVIVVTEGRTDARWLTRALELAAPELAGAFSFLDFEGNSAPGGVDRVVSLTRGMAAAGVMNRVIAVLDNDAAGRAAEQQLRRSALPAHMTVVRLPDVEYGGSYPTIGPSGAQLADVNGRAATIEFMFGTGVLANTSGNDLLPVRWGGYNPSAQAYQGGIEDKGEVNGRIDRALSVSDFDNLHPLVAEGCHRLVGMLVQGAAEAIPPMASQYSPLPWGRARDG